MISSLLASLAVFLVLIILLVLAIVIVLAVSTWKIFEKAGVPGWAVFIPFYRSVKMLQITNRPLWWILLLFVPVVNIILWILVARRLAAAFGKGVGFTWGLVLLPFIFYPILAFGKSVYTNTFPPAQPMSEAVKWTLAAGFLFLLIEGFAMSVGKGGDYAHMPLTVISSSLGYATDDHYVYYQDLPVRHADPISFKVDGAYGMDSQHVYYGDQELSGVDPENFKVLDAGGSYAIAGTDVYYNGSLVSGADSATFVTTEDPSGNYNYDAKDKYGYYSEGFPVTATGQSIIK